MEKNDAETSNNTQKASFQKRLSEKNKLIEILQEKNNTLQKDIQRIQRIMQQSFHKTEEKNKEDQKKQKIIQLTNDPEILNKQLNNCYKKIKLYEYQVDKLKGNSSGIPTSQKLITIQTELKQKKLIQDRLKQQLNTLFRQIAENSKKLSGGHHQEQIQKQYKIKNEQLKFLKEMIRQYETKDSIKQKNLKTQYNHIKKIQKQYLENGGSLNQLDTVKAKAVSQFQQGRLVAVNQKQSSEQNYYDRFNKLSSKSINSSPHNLANPQRQVIQDRTKTHYQSLVNQLSVLQKLNKKYQKQLQQSEKGINDIQGKSDLTQGRLQKLQREIQELNASIKLGKTCIVAENMKPTHRRASMRSVNAKEDIFNNNSVVKEVNKRRRNIINMTAIQTEREQRLYHT